MNVKVVVPADHEHIEGACARTFARSSREKRHAYAAGPQGAPGIDSDTLCDAWQFPLVGSCFGPAEADSHLYNDVTFVYVDGSLGPPATSADLQCTATGLHQRVPFYRLRDTQYFVVTLRVPRGVSHRYRLIVGGRPHLDPVNPQRERTVGGGEWSRFFTWTYNQPVTFEPWEQCLLDRLTRHILPFNGAEAANFIRRQAADVTENMYRLDDSVGASNYIDKVVAREERQHLETYRKCLAMIDRVLRKRYPYADPVVMPERMYVDLYEHLSEDQPHYRSLLAGDGWDFNLYDSPKHFLQVLRRHAWTGAFSHPKYGGNAGGVAWAYLAERYPFAWPRVMEAPLGAALDGYRG